MELEPEIPDFMKVFVFHFILLCCMVSSLIAQDNPTPSFINLGVLTPCECRQPTQFPKTVEDARFYLPCRQMKMVQHFLNLLLDERTFLAGDTLFEDAENGLGNDTIRQQYFFGPYWKTLIAKYTEDEAVSIFSRNLKLGFARMAAVLIASEMPSDRIDGGDDWLWELPGVYVSKTIPVGVPDPTDIIQSSTISTSSGPGNYSLEERRIRMREDVNEWIQKSGIWVFSDVGTPEKISRSRFGDYDFILSQIISFMYMFRDREELVSNESMGVLLHKNYNASFITNAQQRENKLNRLWENRKKADWVDSNVPFAGNDFEQDLWYKRTIVFPETENHVIETLGHYYLTNQWILNNYRNAQKGVTLPSKEVIPSWFSIDSSTQLYQWIRDICARPMHKGFFEDNARIYQGISFTGLLTLATFTQDELLKTEAENALHFLSAKIAFQSLDGRRSPPIRRNCEEAWNLYLYQGDAASFAFHTLAGIYKWNDSPYGFRLLLEDPNNYIRLKNTENPCQGTYWHSYTWKITDEDQNDLGENGNILSDDQLRRVDNFNYGFSSSVLYLLFSDYQIPEAIQDFMLSKYQGYYARMTSQYDRKNYRVVTKLDRGYYDPDFRNCSTRKVYRYFYDDAPYDEPSFNNERTPEIVFATNDYLNVSGGVFNAFEGGGKEGSRYKIERKYNLIPFLEEAQCECHNREGRPLNPPCRISYPYHFLSRPYMIIPNVPMENAKSGQALYKPFGTGRYYSYQTAQRDLPLMAGDSYTWFKSANSATYKNFSYGYKVIPKKIRQNGIPNGRYKKIGGQFPMDLHDDWANTPQTSFGIGEAAAFKIYDLREKLESKGQAGFYLITASLYKGKRVNKPWSRRVARGFWEVVPADKFRSLESLKNEIVEFNDANGFSAGRSNKNKPYVYRLAVSGEALTLYEKYGIRSTEATKKEGQVQGISGIRSDGDAELPLDQVFIKFMNNNFMNTLPLLDVKAVDENYNFLEDDKDDYRLYACARDGWLAVNNFQNGTWFFADSRRKGLFPRQGVYWMGGRFFDDGKNKGGGWDLSSDPNWNPIPPLDAGVVQSCSNPSLCPQRPDLLPRSRVEKSTLELFIYNQGNSSAPASLCEIPFNSLDVRRIPIPAIEAGEYYHVSVSLPALCVTSVNGCNFTVKCDPDQKIEESREDNNILTVDTGIDKLEGPGTLDLRN